MTSIGKIEINKDRVVDERVLFGCYTLVSARSFVAVFLSARSFEWQSIHISA